MNVVKRIARNTLSLAAAYIFSQIITLVLSIFLARFLGEEMYGTYVFAFAIAGLIFVIADFGLNGLLVVEVSKNRSIASRYMPTTLLLRSILGVICILISFSAVLIASYPKDTAFVIMIVAMTSFFGNLTAVFFGMFNAFERMHLNLLVQIIERSFTVTIVIAMLFSGFGLTEIVLVIFAGSILSFSIAYLIFSRSITRPVWKVSLGDAKAQFRRATHFATSSVLITLLYTVNTVLVQIWGGNVAAAYYGVAYNLAIPLSLLHTFFLGAIMPLTSQTFEQSITKLKMIQQKAMKFLFFFGLPITVGGIIVGGEVVTFLYGENFAPAVLPFQILIAVVAVKYFCGNIANVLASANLMRLNAYSAAAGTAVNIGLCVALIPLYGPAGGATAFLLANIVMGFMSLRFMTTRLFSVDYVDIGLKTTVASIALAVFLLIVKSYLDIIFTILAGAIFYFAVGLMIGTFNKGDKDILFRLVKE
ncbi:MAG: flippase [Methanomassiliicoccales archaeon]|jgi:O-antigen/teichoic acid export membrane protein|nr:flippase [Methanomassiliicoccales archaeon]